MAAAAEAEVGASLEHADSRPGATGDLGAGVAGGVVDDDQLVGGLELTSSSIDSSAGRWSAESWLTTTTASASGSHHGGGAGALTAGVDSSDSVGIRRRLQVLELSQASLVLVEAMLEEAHPLGQDLVLVGEARDRQREVQQQQQLGAERGGEQQRRRVVDAELEGDRRQQPAPGGEEEQDASGEQPQPMA